MSLKANGNIERTILCTPASVRSAETFYMRQYNALKGLASDTDFALYYTVTLGAVAAPFITPFGALGLAFVSYLITAGSPTDLEKFTQYSEDSFKMLNGLAKVLDSKVSPNGAQKFDIKFTYKQFKDDKGQVYGVPFKYQITAYYNKNGDKFTM